MTLSVLIPTYNTYCYDLVTALQRQAEGIEHLQYEIVVVDDASSDERVIDANGKIGDLPNCRVEVCPRSSNRSAMRNRLWTFARYEWVLQVNANVVVEDDNYIRKYVESQGDHKIVCGTIRAKGSREEIARNLRCKYEAYYTRCKSIDYHNKNPYRSFRNTNCMYHRSVLEALHYDEAINGYGYEDVLYGKILSQHHVPILYIDNDVMYDCSESNDAYLCKTEKSLHTLHGIQDMMHGYSPLLSCYCGAKEMHLLWILKAWHKVFGGMEKRNLTGKRPNMLVYKLYKLGYFVSLD